MFKKAGLALLTLAVVAAVALAGVGLYGLAARPASAQRDDSVTTGAGRTITVVGQGTSRVQPDIAQVSIGVETLSPTVSAAAEQNQTQMAAILAALKKAGIADKDIQTMNYSISYERYAETLPAAEGSGLQPKSQYRVSNMVTVTVRDLDKVGEVLDSVVAAGANSIWGVSFSVDDQKPAQSDARAKAIADAKARAEELARLAGVSLGSVQSISEVVGGSTLPTAMMAERAMGGGGTNISPGEVELGYQVQVVFALEP
jgi:hypothetical protein